MNIYISIFAMALTTYLIRMLPLTLFQKKIKNRFLRSFFNLRSLCLSDCNDISVNSLFYQFPYQRAHRLSGRHSGLSLGQKSRDGSRLQLRCGFSNRTDSLFSLKVFLQIKKL